MRNKKIFKFLSIFILLFSFINISNAIDLPTAYNSAASDIASPEKVRKAIDIRYPELKDRYCKDYRASTQTNIKLVVRCGDQYALTEEDLDKVPETGTGTTVGTGSTTGSGTTGGTLNLLGEGQVIYANLSNLLDCQTGLTKIIPADHYTYSINNFEQSVSVSSNGDKVCAKLGDGICKNYENEITSISDCKKTFQLKSFKIENNEVKIKYDYKDISGKKVKVLFEYFIKNNSNTKKDFLDETGEIELKTTGTNRIEAGKKYEYYIYDNITKKPLNSGEFELNGSGEKAKLGEVIEYGKTGECENGLSLVYIKEAYNSHGYLISGKDKICIKKNDGNCDSRYENEYNSPEDCTMTCTDAVKPELSSNCTAREIKDSNDCITGYKITCSTMGGGTIIGDNIDMDNCLDEKIYICGKKNNREKTYKNICFAIKDRADILYAGRCDNLSELRDEKGCLKSTYNWCSTLNRCLKKVEYCPVTNYRPNISDDIKEAVNGYLDKFYKKIKDKYTSKEKRLQVIDKISKKIDGVIDLYPKYKDILSFIIQEVEEKRVYFMSN